ncbi:hypothetical protein [Desulfobulbus alkaliphilus]|uniref:hypothetical protein n=1 Tax=Desulfobulbus alkaliphilus TaxID=869814 RepID=UPI0019628299|nr:hypothetical protein [Desulfobulbus alkaliphilus]MBM9538709.1 hypothetical protein [Desulfobulbus alkaliphilus]
MYIRDYLLIGAALAVTIWYLYRRIVVTRGCGCSASTCSAVPPEPGTPKTGDSGECAGCAATREWN